MQKVLLAIDGINPDRKVFDYAVQLCQRIKADLSIFQVINPRRYKEYLKTIRTRADNARKYFEGAMVAATFAEAGEHETAREIMSMALENINRLVPESEKAGVQCHFAVKTGNPAKEIINYVNVHRDVVLTIYDASIEGREGTQSFKRQQGVSRKIKQKLAVPLVVFQN